VPKTSINATLSDVIGSASFLLTTIALLITAIAIAFSAWANYKAKQFELQTTRLDIAYRLIIAASGGGDARMPNGTTHYSGVEVQTAAIASLRAFPEYADVYERLLVERKRFAAANGGELEQVLMRETESLVAAVKSYNR
jgi:hypothetical protein